CLFTERKLVADLPLPVDPWLSQSHGSASQKLDYILTFTFGGPCSREHFRQISRSPSFSWRWLSPLLLQRKPIRRRARRRRAPPRRRSLLSWSRQGCT